MLRYTPTNSYFVPALVKRLKNIWQGQIFVKTLRVKGTKKILKQRKYYKDICGKGDLVGRNHLHVINQYERSHLIKHVERYCEESIKFAATENFICFNHGETIKALHDIGYNIIRHTASNIARPFVLAKSHQKPFQFIFRKKDTILVVNDRYHPKKSMSLELVAYQFTDEELKNLELVKPVFLKRIPHTVYNSKNNIFVTKIIEAVDDFEKK